MDATADRNDLWRLAELADMVDDQWGESKLAKFKEIGLAHCTIKRRRSTYRNWKQIFLGDPGLRKRLSYAVARELEKHPQREKLVNENRRMTKRQAAQLMKDYRDPETEMRKRQRWWKDLMVRVNKALGDEDVLPPDPLLRKVVQQNMLGTIREAAQEWILNR